MANYLGEKLGAKVELVTVTTTNRIPYLQTGRVELVISTLGRNAEREKVIDFTAAYSPFFIGVFGPKSTAAATPAELAGKTIGVTRGSVDDTELTAVAPASAVIRRFEDNNATISAFVAGQTQLVATSAQVASTMMQRNPQLGTEYKFLLKESPNFIGVAKGETALRDRVNAIIADAREKGDIDKLSQKWLGRSAGDLPK
jgi:polar amino acid transport system substrate-binding protein